MAGYSGWTDCGTVRFISRSAHTEVAGVPYEAGKLKAVPNKLPLYPGCRGSRRRCVASVTKFVDSAGDHYWKSGSDCLLGINVFEYLYRGQVFLISRKIHRWPVDRVKLIVRLHAAAWLAISWTTNGGSLLRYFVIDEYIELIGRCVPRSRLTFLPLFAKPIGLQV